MALLLDNPTAVAAISAILVALLNYLTRRLEMRDRAEQRAAVLAVHSNSAALDALAATSSQSFGKINSGPIILLAIGFAAAIYTPAETVFALSSDGGKECSTAADCRDGDRCERGRCVSSARKPAGAPKKTTNYHDELALWWSPPHLRRDPFEPALASY